MQIVLDVPFVTQLGFGDPANRRDDPTGCWYASACMVAYFFGAGPRVGDPTKYKAGLGELADGTKVAGHQGNWYGEGDFIKNEGLERVVLSKNHKWTASELADLLRKYGPILYTFEWENGGHKGYHVCVLIGVIGNNVVFHDPEARPNQTQTLAEFNKILHRSARAPMLRRAGPAFQATPAPKPPTVSSVAPRPFVPSNQKVIDKLASTFGSLFG